MGPKLGKLKSHAGDGKVGVTVLHMSCSMAVESY